MTERQAFGPSLRSERERRGITLDAVAQSTKLKACLFAALERNDLSQLPVGFFRRALLRAYATAIGLPTEPLVAQFLRLFPESSAPGERIQPAGGSVTGSLRLTLEPDRRWNGTVWVRRVVAAIGDTAAVLLMTAAIVRVTGASPWTTGGAVGLSYYAVFTACLGRSLASWYLDRAPSPRRTDRQALEALHVTAAESDGMLQIHAQSN